ASPVQGMIFQMKIKIVFFCAWQPVIRIKPVCSVFLDNDPEQRAKRTEAIHKDNWAVSPGSVDNILSSEVFDKLLSCLFCYFCNFGLFPLYLEVTVYPYSKTGQGIC
ncbi:hypothetical protein GOODEAATRI_018186, partial [Goodea atripinnis]